MALTRTIKVKQTTGDMATIGGQVMTNDTWYDILDEAGRVALYNDRRAKEYLFTDPPKVIISNGSFELDSQSGLDWITLEEQRTADGIVLHTPVKSYTEKSKSFTTPDFSNRQTWFFDYTQVTDEVMTTSDNTIYSSTRTPTTGWDHDWINYYKVPNHIRQTDSGVKVVVKKNDVVITSGFTIDYTNGTVTFDSANDPGDVIKVTYRYANSSRYDLTALTGKKLLVDYIETQFSVGCVIPPGAYMIFQAVYNGPAVPSYGIPANTDVVLNSYEYYSGADFLNESNQAYLVKAFMEMTKDVNILPWKYLTGHTIKSPGCSTTDITKNEFNKLRMQILDINGGPDPIVGDCEIATGTVYTMIKDV